MVKSIVGVVLTVIGIIVCVCGMIAFAFFVLRGIDRLRAARPARKNPPESKEEYRKRLLHPKWDEVAAYYGRPAPDDLREMYSDTQLLLMEDFFVVDPKATLTHDKMWHIEQFLPLESATISARWPELESNLLEFARDMLGNPFLLRMTDDPKASSPVFFWMHDGATDIEPVANSLEEFLSWERRPGTHT